jgi:hypothetical protein
LVSRKNAEKRGSPLTNDELAKWENSKILKMKTLTLILLLTISISAKGQNQERIGLFQELKTQDSIFFERGFNHCDLDYLKKQVADDLRFYHDQGGLQNKSQFLENTVNNICASSAQKPIRKVAPESLEVFPLYAAGKIYGAIQKGVHHFYIRENGKKDLWTSTARFTHLWILEKENWKLTEVLSYDHQSTSPPSSQTN